MDFAIEIIPNKELKDAAKVCNKNGVFVRGLFPSFSIYEMEYITLEITSLNEPKIMNIIQMLEKNKVLKIGLIYTEREHKELIKIFSNAFNKEKVFSVVKKSCANGSLLDNLSVQMQEIYKMHKMLVKEDISHEIRWNDGVLTQSISIGNISSSFDYGAERIKNIYAMQLWKSLNNESGETYHGRFVNENYGYKKIKNINSKIEEEFKWQEKEFNELCNKYKMNIAEQGGDMFSRLEKVRDYYEP